MNVVKFPNSGPANTEQLLAGARIPKEFHAIGAAVLCAELSTEDTAKAAGRQVCGLLTAMGELLVDAPLPSDVRSDEAAMLLSRRVPQYSFLRTLDDNLGRAMATRLHSRRVPSDGYAVSAVSIYCHDKMPYSYVLDMRAYMEQGAPLNTIYTTVTMSPGVNCWTMTLMKGVVRRDEKVLPEHRPSFGQLTCWRQALLHDTMLLVPRPRDR